MLELMKKKKCNEQKRARYNVLHGALCFYIAFIGFNGIIFAAASDTLSQKDVTKSRIEDLKSQIQMYQQQIDAKSAKEESISNDISIIQADIKKIELQIQENELQIFGLDTDISQKETEIESMQKQVDGKNRMLSRLLQVLYEKGGLEAEQIILGQQNFSEYYAEVENLQDFESQIREVHDQLVLSRDELRGQKEKLIEDRIEKENMRTIQLDQQNALVQEKQMESLLVSQIRNEKQALESNVGRLRVELGNLQALGSPINIDEAISAAKYAAKITGVAPEFLLGVLKVESGLGTNVGGGKYKTDMNPDQWDTFRKICRDLGFDPDKMPVSRRACYNKDASDGCGGWGGAMGPAQFMPATWTAYKPQVEKAVGHSDANPWDLQDSLVAMGLKLGNVAGVKNGERSAWAKAAGMYLAGGNWENYSWYSDRVLYYADGFKKIMK